MRIVLAACVATVLHSCAAQGDVVPEMTPALIKEAIALGAKNKGEGCYALRSVHPIGPMGCISTPFSRVVGAAQEATQKYKAFTEADVTAEMIAPELRIHAFANTHSRGSVVSVENVILRPKGAKGIENVTRPLRIEESEGTYRNAMGGEWTGKSMVAAFPIDALDDDTEVRVIYKEPVCMEGSMGIAIGKRPRMTADCGARLGDPLKKMR